MRVAWLVLWMGLSAVFSGTAWAASISQEQVAQGEVLVKFRAGVPAARKDEIHRAVGGRVLETWPQIGWQRVGLAEDIGVEQAIRQYRQYPEVENAEPNYLRGTQPRP